MISDDESDSIPIYTTHISEIEKNFKKKLKRIAKRH